MATKSKTKKSTSPKRRFGWAKGGFAGVDPQLVGQELAALEVKPGDCNRTVDVLNAARNPNSELHKCFPWDDEEAAEAHRLAIARKLIRTICYVMVREDKIEKTPVYYHVRDAEGPRYVNSDRLKTDDELRQAAIEEALTQLKGFRTRFQSLTELKPVLSAIDQFAANMQKKAKE